LLSVHRGRNVTATGGDLFGRRSMPGRLQAAPGRWQRCGLRRFLSESRDCCLNKLRRLREGWRWQAFIIHGRFPAMLLGARGNILYFDARNLWPDAIGESSCRPITHHPISTTPRTIYAPGQFGRACMHACWDLRMRRLGDCSPSRMIWKPEQMPQSALLSPPALCSPELHRRPQRSAVGPRRKVACPR
jgi:hypothetical protein